MPAHGLKSNQCWSFLCQLIVVPSKLLTMELKESQKWSVCGRPANLRWGRVSEIGNIGQFLKILFNDNHWILLMIACVKLVKLGQFSCSL